MYVRVCGFACVRIHSCSVRSNSCKYVVLEGWEVRFLATRSSRMNVEAASDMDPKY